MARRVVVEILGDSSQLERTFRRSARSANEFQRQVGRGTRGAVAATVAFRGMGRSIAFASGAFLGGAGLTAAVESSISAASDLNEQVSKSDQVFGRSADAIEEWSTTTTKAFGVSQRQALTLASSFGALLRPIGFTGDAAAQQSRRLVELGADLASFYNTDVQDALDAIRAGLVGEMEPLRRYGVRLSEARVQQEALRETGKRHARQLTEQEKTMARLAILFRDSTIAQGNFALTSGGLANQLRIAQANVDDLQAAIGQQLIPMVTNAVTAFNDWIGKPENRAKVINDISKAVDGLAASVGALANAWSTVDRNVSGVNKFLDEHHLGFLNKGLLATIHDLHFAADEFERSAEAIARAQERAVVNPPGTRGPNLAPGAGAAQPTTTTTPSRRRGVTVAQRNQWFDTRIARELNKLQDLGLRKQLAGLKHVAAEVRARLAVTKDVTRRNTLNDELLDIYRQQRSVQEQISEQIKTQNQALKERAEAIKSAILERLQRRQTDVENRRALRDAQEQLRQARILGGPLGIRQARETLADVRNRILIAQLERRPARLRGGVFTLGAITINVHGVTDPEKVAQIVVNTIERKRRHGTTQARGPYAGRH